MFPCTENFLQMSFPEVLPWQKKAVISYSDAAFLRTVGSFVLTAELFYLQLTI